MSADKDPSFNDNHPEMEDGEMFLGNLDKATFDSMTGLTTKRCGGRAYDRGGMDIPESWNLSPVFCERKEYEENMR